jgi:hypothetical protein
MAKFPSAEWVQAVMDKLNTDAHYAQVARGWEGDMRYVVDPGGPLTEPLWIYLDCGMACRQAFIESPDTQLKPAYFEAAMKHAARSTWGD